MENELSGDSKDTEPHLLQTELEIKSVKSMSMFMTDIERIKNEYDVSYIDAVLQYCEENGIEIESAGQFIKSIPPLKAKIQEEAESLNFLPKTAKLPI